MYSAITVRRPLVTRVVITSVVPVLLVSRDWTRVGVLWLFQSYWMTTLALVVPIKFIVIVRHALIASQSYDVRVHVYTYSKMS